jgi:hypothetical protein
MKLSVANRVLRIVVPVILASVLVVSSQSQTAAYERAFPQSKDTIERALASLQGNLAGRLPLLDGFAKPGEHPLDRYKRGYFQTTVQVSSAPAGGSIVRVNTKVTAWFADPTASHSGYQLLASNGRLEADLLDQLSEQLAQSQSTSDDKTAPVGSANPSVQSPAAAESAISVPSQRFPTPERTFPSSLSQGLAAEHSSDQPDQKNSIKATSALQAEADSLEGILKNQGHPKNLVAVKKSGTPVVATPSLTAKPQFLASMHDEFELLDFNADWVHVRVSGLSRGWIWRNSVEMPNGMHDTSAPVSAAMAPAADLFHVIHEEASTFPGDWAPLKNKSVKIISVQKIDENAKDAGSSVRLEYAKFLFDKGYQEIAQKPQDLAGIVVIFDSSDGGMVAATLSSLQQWKAGTLSDSALWHKCFFDPPETFDSSGSSASQ